MVRRLEELEKLEGRRFFSAPYGAGARTASGTAARFARSLAPSALSRWRTPFGLAGALL